MKFDFGQPLTGIIQMAYVVDDIHAAMASWRQSAHLGPWFHLERWTPDPATYRGQRSEATITLAMAFSGALLIELIQPLDDKPSVYKETIERTGYGFHHFAVGSNDFEADVRRYEQHGYSLAFQARVPTGGRVGYLDTKGSLPGFIEVIENGPEMERVFTKFHRAAIQWDGSEPVRAFL